MWHGEGFTYLENVVFYDTFMDLRPFVYKFPSEMYPYAGEWRKSVVKIVFNTDVNFERKLKLFFAQVYSPKWLLTFTYQFYISVN